MDQITRNNLDKLNSEDRMVQGRAFQELLAATEKPVGWAYEAWDELLGGLNAKDNHLRAIAAQLLCSLAKSDPQGRMLRDFPALLAVTKDERFVTARHTLLALCKVGAAGSRQRELLLNGLDQRFQECISEKNCTLIRYDIIVCLRSLYEAVKDESIKRKALAWIETESDLKYRKKYAGVWKGMD